MKTVTRGSDTFAYAYDPVGNVTQRTYPGQTPIDYVYDGLDRMITISNAGTTSFGYDIASNQTSATPWNGQVETRVYDRIGRLTEVKTEKAGVTLARFVSSLDPVGNPTQVVRTGALVETQTYTYDANDRLTGVCFQAGTCPGGSDPFVRWTYDKVGNRLTGQQPTQTLTYNYNALDQLTSVGSTIWTYDQNGNQLSRGPRTFTYDQANRLKTATIAPTTTTYSYDGDGVRRQASTGAGASEKTNFLWDLNQALPQLALERDGANALLRRYTYGVRMISMVAGSTTSFYHYDDLGSVASITGGAGATRWTYSYGPFGSIRSEQQGAGTQPANFMKYTGEYLDPTGLYHLRARQYDPTWSRFMRPDLVESDVGSPYISAYVYAGNRPTVMVDPSGETFRPSDLGTIGAFFAASRISTGYLSPLCGGGGRWTVKIVVPTCTGGGVSGGGGVRTGGGGAKGGSKPPRAVPTSNLGKALEAAGELRPGPEWIAHHIVARAHTVAAPARAILQRASVRIDEARNGVWILKPGGHPERYYRTVNERLLRAERTGGRRGVTNELSAIKSEIKRGRLGT